jgi:hypothetical protein
MSWKSVWIYLKSQIKFWNLKILFKSEWNSCISNFYFKHKVVPWVCIQTYHVIDSNTHTWHHSDGFMFEIDISRQYRFWDGIRKFQIWTKISNLKTRDLRFQINSNRFSRHTYKFWASVSALLNWFIDHLVWAQNTQFRHSILAYTSQLRIEYKGNVSKSFRELTVLMYI